MRFLGHFRWFFGGFVLVEKRETKTKTQKLRNLKLLMLMNVSNPSAAQMLLYRMICEQTL